MMKTQTRWILLGVGVLLMAVGGVVTAGRLGQSRPPEVPVPDEFKGKIPDRSARFLFADLKSFAESMLRDRPPLEALQCTSVGFTVGFVRDQFDIESVPRSLAEWRGSGYLLWEYPLLTDVSQVLPADFGKDDSVRALWLKSAAPGSFFIVDEGPHKSADGSVIAHKFLVGCTVPPSPFNKRGFVTIGLDIMPRGTKANLRLLPEEVKREIEMEQEAGVWTTRAWQLRFGYAGYVLTKKRHPANLSELGEVMGKASEKAWKDEVLTAYAEKYFLPAARKGFEEAGFTPAGP